MHGCAVYCRHSVVTGSSPRCYLLRGRLKSAQQSSHSVDRGLSVRKSIGHSTLNNGYTGLLIASQKTPQMSSFLISWFLPSMQDAGYVKREFPRSGSCTRTTLFTAGFVANLLLAQALISFQLLSVSRNSWNKRFVHNGPTACWFGEFLTGLHFLNAWRGNQMGISGWPMWAGWSNSKSASLR